jgi:hypothetical protein
MLIVILKAMFGKVCRNEGVTISLLGFIDNGYFQGDFKYQETIAELPKVEKLNFVSSEAVIVGIENGIINLIDGEVKYAYTYFDSNLLCSEKNPKECNLDFINYNEKTKLLELKSISLSIIGGDAETCKRTIRTVLEAAVCGIQGYNSKGYPKFNIKGQIFFNTEFKEFENLEGKIIDITPKLDSTKFAINIQDYEFYNNNSCYFVLAKIIDLLGIPDKCDKRAEYQFFVQGGKEEGVLLPGTNPFHYDYLKFLDKTHVRINKDEYELISKESVAPIFDSYHLRLVLKNIKRDDYQYTVIANIFHRECFINIGKRVIRGKYNSLYINRK